MKALKNIVMGLFHAFVVVSSLLGSICGFALIFGSQSFMAILYFVMSLVSLAASLSYALVIGQYMSDDNENIVKCKDCTEWNTKECECSHWYGFTENDFCCHGIKRGTE